MVIRGSAGNQISTTKIKLYGERFTDLVETGRSDVRNKIGAVLKELLRCNGRG